MEFHVASQYIGEYYQSIALGFTLGISASLFYKYVLPLRYCPTNPFMSELIQLRRSQWAKRKLVEELGAFEQNDIYGLEQGVLNIELLPQTMWMNVGFWKENTKSLPQACQCLVEEILRTAQIWDNNNAPPFSILEVGCGCAETMHFLRTAFPQRFRHYIGITINGSQAAFASKRLVSVTSATRNAPPNQSHIYHADASKPDTWPLELHNNLEELSFSTKRDRKDSEKEVAEAIWVLALDTLYHFSPSRKDILTFAHHELKASLMATDIIISDKIPWIDCIKLRLIFYGLGVPWGNILTKREYIQMLVECGYEEENVKIRDITKRSFEGFENFTRQQMDLWEVLGGSKVISRPVRMMGWVAGWWARSGTVQECIVIAKHSSLND